MQKKLAPINNETEITFAEAEKLSGYSKRMLRYLVTDGKVRSRRAITPILVEGAALSREDLLNYCSSHGRTSAERIKEIVAAKAIMRKEVK